MNYRGMRLAPVARAKQQPLFERSSSMSNLIQSISEQFTAAELALYQQNVEAMSAQECSHLIMMAFDELATR
jgi:hypothetical protein